MNPFELHGPEFLAFYAVLAVAVITGLVVMRRRLGPDGPPNRRINDPYDIALLRGGPIEAIRVAALAMIDRKLLIRCDDTLRAAAGAVCSDDLESAILASTTAAIEPHRIPGLGVVRIAIDRRRERLEGLGLAPDATMRRQHLGLAFTAFAVLAGTAFAKIVYAMSNGHHNVVFLFVLGFFASIVALGVGLQIPPATRQGRATLALLSQLFAPLRQQRRPAKPDERTFLAAVYGATALGGVDKLMWQQFTPKANQASGGCGSTMSCGSSGGSSCSSSGCGGGGCGGCGS